MRFTAASEATTKQPTRDFLGAGWRANICSVRDLPGLPLRPLPSGPRRWLRDDPLAAAADLTHVGLADALELLLLLLESELSRFERAALRWHGRYCREVRDVDLIEAQAVLACRPGFEVVDPSRPPMRSRILSTGDLARSSEV